jgi:hypothetical protein
VSWMAGNFSSFFSGPILFMFVTSNICVSRKASRLEGNTGDYAKGRCKGWSEKGGHFLKPADTTIF